MKEVPSPNFGNRREGKTPTMIILHYTAASSAEVALNWMQDPEGKVSAHYLVDVDGEVIRLVAEDKRAWHAGKSFWAGEADINSCSIGIEIQNLGVVSGHHPYPDIQIESVINLCRDIIRRHNIPAKNILGHSDVAPQRKQDPGELFPWQRLAGEGIGLWPSGTGPALAPPGDTLRLQQLLAVFGYEITPDGDYGPKTTNVVTAFQRHWQPDKVDGIPDEITQERLKALL